MKLTTKLNIKNYENIPNLKIPNHSTLLNPIIVGYILEGKKKRPVVKATCICGKETFLSLKHYKITKSCGCRLGRKHIQKDFEYPIYVKNTDNIQRRYNDYIKRAKSRNLEFKLDFKTLESLITSKCSYCSYTGGSIDRVDNDLGYLENNVVSCCKFCNRAKHETSKQEFLNWLNFVKEPNSSAQ